MRLPACAPLRSRSASAAVATSGGASARNTPLPGAILRQVATVHGRSHRRRLGGVRWERGRDEYQAPYLRWPSRRKLCRDRGTETLAEHVDLAQAHGLQKVANGRGVLCDARVRWRWIRIPKTGQIRGKNRTSDPGNRKKARENSTGMGDWVQAKEGGALLETTACGNGVVDVQLAVAAFEIAATQPRLRCRRGARM